MFKLRFTKNGMYSLLVYSKLKDDKDKPDLEASIAGYLFQVGRRTLPVQFNTLRECLLVRNLI